MRFITGPTFRILKKCSMNPVCPYECDRAEFSYSVSRNPFSHRFVSKVLSFLSTTPEGEKAWKKFLKVTNLEHLTTNSTELSNDHRIFGQMFSQEVYKLYQNLHKVNNLLTANDSTLAASDTTLHTRHFIRESIKDIEASFPLLNSAWQKKAFASKAKLLMSYIKFPNFTRENLANEIEDGYNALGRIRIALKKTTKQSNYNIESISQSQNRK